jgi:hypothetical protein
MNDNELIFKIRSIKQYYQFKYKMDLSIKKNIHNLNIIRIKSMQKKEKKH